MPVTKKGYKKKVAGLEGQVAGMKAAGHKVPVATKAAKIKKVGKWAAPALAVEVGGGYYSNYLYGKKHPDGAKRKSNYPTTRTHSFSPNT